MKFHYVLVLVALLCAPMPAQDKPLIGADKSVTIKSPAKFARDSKVLLQVSGLDGLKSRLKWWVRSNDGKAPPDFEVFNDGKTCAVWAPPGNYEALVTVGVIEGTDVLWFDVEHKFVVGGEVPTPPDPNNPDPPPSPQDDFKDVTVKIKELLGPVKDTDKNQGLDIVAKAYAEHAKLAKTYPNVDTMADATASQIVYELGLNRYVKYRPAFTRIRELLSELMKGKRVQNLDDWARVWYAISQGATNAKNQSAVQ